VTFPFTVTPDVVDVLIKKTGDTFPVNMYCWDTTHIINWKIYINIFNYIFLLIHIK
jgi:hypothetical protein